MLALLSREGVQIPDELIGKVKLLTVGKLTKRKGADLLPKIMRALDQGNILFYTNGLRRRGIFDEPNVISLGRIGREKLVEMYNFCDILLFIAVSS